MNNKIDWVQSGKWATVVIKEFLFDNSFWNSKDRNIILLCIFICLFIFSFKVFGDGDEQEIINQIKDKYNNIRKEYYESDSVTINKLQSEINILSTKREIYTKCRDYNYAHYNTVVEPINCDEQLDKQLEIIKGWKVNSAGLSQAFVPLISSSLNERINELLIANWRGEDVLENRWQRVADKYELKASVLVCIAKADSSLGQALKTKNNFGNVGNNDRWDKVSFASPIQGIEAIAQTLNNSYLGGYNTIDQLSRYGNKEWKIYASSPDNWHNNVTNCLSSLYGERIEDTFNFRK